MLNPIRLCNNLFDDKELSDSNLRSFTEDHLLRLNNNNPGAIYSALITNTTTKYTAYYGKMSSEQIQVQIKEGLTVTKTNARDAVQAKLSSLQGLVKFKFGETSATYQEFYPQGMAAFYQAKDGDLEILLDAFQASAVTHLTADFPAEVTAVTNLITAYKNAYSSQNNAFSLIDNLITGKHGDRLALTTQLTFNFLTVASNNIGNPDAFDDFYDPAYLPITREGDEPVVKEGDIDVNKILNIDLSDVTGGNANTEFKLKNPGTSNLRYYFSPTLGGPPASTFTDVQPGDTIEKTAAELGASDVNIFFTVHNIGGAPGSYRVEIMV